MSPEARIGEARFRQALDGLLEGVQILDGDLRYVYVNAAAAAQGRLTVDRVVGRLMREVFPGVEVTEFYQTLERMVAGAPAERLDAPFQFPDGTLSYFQLIIEPLDGGVFILSVERTAEVEAKAALAVSEARHRAMLRGIPDLVFLLSADGIVIDAHTPDDVPLLRPREQIIGSHLEESLPPELATKFAEVIARVRATRERVNLEYELSFPDGTRRFEASAVMSESHQITVIARDVTLRVDLEEQLRQAQKMEAIGQLTGGIAHDFNNVLQVISANAEFLAMNAESQQVATPIELQEILTAAARGADMVSHLLRFARRGVLRRKAVDPAVVIENAVALLRRLLPESVHLDASNVERGTTLMLDAGALEQVIANLCTNARDAMPDGGTIHISARRAAIAASFLHKHPWLAPGEYYRISVQDSGDGMDENTLRRVFEPFFTTKPVGVGTGLGMSMVYGLMKSHGGAVDVTSVVACGTEVSLYFPVVASAASPDGSAQHAEYETAPGGTETILLVEDDAAIRGASARALVSKGYRVLEAADGAQGLLLFGIHRDEIGIVVSDLVMPNLGGRQLAEALRAQGSMVPVLFTSGYSDEWLYGETGVPSDLHFLSKPWTLVDLFRAIRRAIHA